MDSGQPQAVAALFPGKELQYLLIRRLDGPHSWRGRFGGKLNIFPLLGFDAWIVQPAASSLYWLRHFGSYKNMCEV
jgi:hypothetical protein